MSTLAGAPRGRVALGLTVLRVVVGIVFIVHGAQKVFVYGHPGVTGMLTKFGVPVPGVASIIVMVVELVGGLALFFGVFTRLAAALLAIDMGVAFALVHVKHGFFLPMGFEFVMTLFGGLVALLLAGPGAAALDNRLFRRPDRI